MSVQSEFRGRLARAASPSLQNWQAPAGPMSHKMKKRAEVDMGWGRILFGHTFQSVDALFDALCKEGAGKRDIAFYIRDPHVMLAKGPDKLFLDPSHTFRLWAHDYHHSKRHAKAFKVRRILNEADANAVNRIYLSRNMVTDAPGHMLNRSTTRRLTILVAEDLDTERIVGTVTGIDHVAVFNDPECGASLWCLAVDPQAKTPGVGEALVRHLVEHYLARGRSFVDLSVMADNQEAIALYEKLGFQRVPVFCIKRKNSINEPLFVAALPEADLNPYARIITDEARRRGIGVEVVDAENGFFDLTLGGRVVSCRESLTELTSAIAMSRCDDKRVTRRILQSAGLKVPAQIQVRTDMRSDAGRFLDRYGQVVVKPARGEQGDGVSVDVRTEKHLAQAIEKAHRFCPDVIVEECVAGEDLRIIVIDDQMVAAAVRRPPVIVGSGHHTIRELIGKYNRRRMAATDGESRIPVDNETERCVTSAGWRLDDVLSSDTAIQVRNAANLHTGGTIHDVTDDVHPELKRAAERAAEALAIPVTGLDFIVPDVNGPEYCIIEANERPGLANHEPQPTAERFIDLLFPQTVSKQ